MNSQQHARALHTAPGVRGSFVPPHESYHTPSVRERLEVARCSLLIARFAAREGEDLSLFRRELARARAEVREGARRLGRACSRLIRRGRHPSRELVKALEIARLLDGEIRTLSRRTLRLN